jgi:hypothetical protein
VAPFLVQFCSEYVGEILQEIQACLPLLDRRVYGTIPEENLAFLNLASNA